MEKHFFLLARVDSRCAIVGTRPIQGCHAVHRELRRPTWLDYPSPSLGARAIRGCHRPQAYRELQPPIGMDPPSPRLLVRATRGIHPPQAHRELQQPAKLESPPPQFEGPRHQGPPSPARAP